MLLFIVFLNELIETGYGEKIKNPYDTSAFCDEINSYVKVVGSGNSLNNLSANYEVCLVCGDVKSVDRFTMSEAFISVSRFSETEIVEIAKVTVEQNVKVYEGINSFSFYVRKDNKLYHFIIFNRENRKEFYHARNTFLYDTTWLKKERFGRVE